MPVIHALGTSVRVDPGEGIDAETFAAAWSRCLSDGPPTDDAGSTVAGAGSMTALTQAVTLELITRRTGELLMLHAGAVCDRSTGATVAYAAHGGTGKTTLTTLLGQTLGYVTDETVGIVPGTWEVRAYPKPLSIRSGDPAEPKAEHSPDRLGLGHSHAAPWLTALLVLRRDPELVSPRFTRLGLFDAIMALVPETSSLARLERPLHLLADLYRDLGGFWLVEYAQAEDIATWVRSLVEAE